MAEPDTAADGATLSHQATETDVSTFHRLDTGPILPQRGLDLPMRAIVGQDMMMVGAEIPAGATLPVHAHSQEQFTYVISGRMRFLYGEQRDEEVLAVGAVIHVPSGVLHGVEALENCVVLDVFHPKRPDLLS